MRVRRRPQHILALGRTMEGAWERTSGGIALPTATMTVDTGVMLEFYEYLTRGLYHHHVGQPLSPQVTIRSRMLPAAEEAVFVADLVRALGPNVRHVEGNIGSGVLRYSAVLSNVVVGATSWQIDLAGMRWAIGAETPRTLVTRMHVSTVPPVPDQAEGGPEQSTSSEAL